MATPWHRELARRQHRTLGHFLAVESWRLTIDCVVLSRSDLEHFLGLKRFKGARVKWLQRDIKPWFPFQNVVYFARAGRPLGGMYLSRVTLDDVWSPRIMTDKKRVAALNAAGVRTAQVDGGIPTEGEIVGRLMQMASGLAAPS